MAEKPELYQVVENIARLSIFIPLFFYVIRKSKTKEIKVIFWFIVFVLLHQLIFSSLRARSLMEASVFFNAFYTPIELLFAGTLVRYSLKTFSTKKLILYIEIAYFVLWAPLLFTTKFTQFDYLINGVSYSLIIAFCLIYFYEQIKSLETLFIYTQSPFWAVVAFFLFASGTFFVFIFDQLAAGEKTFEDQYVFIHAIFFTARNIFFTIAILINFKKLSYVGASPSVT